MTAALPERYEPYGLVVDPADTDFQDCTLDTVTELESGFGWDVAQRGTHCIVPRLDHRGMTAGRLAQVPQVGDHLRVYGSVGRPIEGQMLNGVVLWYRDRTQRAERRRRELVDREADLQRRFVIEQPELDARYERLPAPFRARLDRFRTADPRFRVESESYESFCLEQAALLAAHFVDDLSLRRWAKLGAAEQKAAEPPDYSDQHSGNTHGAAVAFACALIRGEDV